jgi:hypothetical protein
VNAGNGGARLRALRRTAFFTKAAVIFASLETTAILIPAKAGMTEFSIAPDQTLSAVSLNSSA